MTRERIGRDRDTSVLPILGRVKSSRAAALALSMTLLVGGCSAVPDWANPVEWYDSAGSESDGAAQSASASEDRTVPGEEEDFPKLSSVPERPEGREPQPADRELRESLAADRERARYTDQSLRANTSLSEPLPRPKPQTGTDRAEEEAAEADRSESSKETEAARETGEAASSGGARTVEAAELSKPESETSEMSDEVRAAGSNAVEETRAVASVEETPAEDVEETKARSSEDQSSSSSSSSATRSDQGQASGGEGDMRISGEGDLVQRTYREMLRESGASAVDTAQAHSFEPLPDVPPQVASRAAANPGGGAASQASSAPATRAADHVISFAQGSASLSAAARAEVATIARQAIESDASVHVVGHSSRRTRDLSATEHRLANLEVSAERASSVAAELIRQGVAPDRISMEAMGASAPLYAEAMPKGEAANRRVEIFLEK